MREDLELTQAQLAERLEVSRAALAQIESGRSAPSFWLLMRLGQHVGDERVDRDAAAIFALFHAAAHELRTDGVRVVNRMLREGEPTIPQAQVDRAVARVFDEEFAEYEPLQVAVFAGEEGEE